MSDRVPAEPVRRAVEQFMLETGTPVSRLAEDLGFLRTKHVGRYAGRVWADTSGFKRSIGMMSRRTKGTAYKGKTYGDYVHTNQTVDYDLAVRIALLIGADPVELGV